MPAPCTGHCLCGAIRFRVNGAPIAHQWTRSAQPWFVFPPRVATFETQPADRAERVALWRRAHPGAGSIDGALP